MARLLTVYEDPIRLFHGQGVPMQPQSQPAAERLAVLDAIRGFALCGILLINIPHMAWIMSSDEPVRGVRDGGLSTALWWIQMLLVNGNMRGLFSLLFGASMLLFLAKAERGSATRAEANRLMLRRLFWLFMFLARRHPQHLRHRGADRASLRDCPAANARSRCADRPCRCFRLSRGPSASEAGRHRARAGDRGPRRIRPEPLR